MRGTNKIKRLIQHISGLEIKGSKEVEITGITSDSRQVASGNLFVAKRGSCVDGNQFISDAIAAGAVAVLTDMFNPFLSVVQLIHSDVAMVEAKLSAHFFAYPSKELKVIGITGTNGKTTTSFLIKGLLEKAQIKTGLIGTIEWIVGEHRFVAHATTPDVVTNHKLLRDMVQEGCKAAVMEVSSHGLAQNRVGEIDFSLAVFTNFSQDHLDYHQSMDEYFQAKARLFQNLTEDKWAIVNADEHLPIQTKAKIFTYGTKKAQLMASDLQLSDRGSRFTLSFQDQKLQCSTQLIGRFNVYNILAALSVGLCMGLSLETTVGYIKTFKGIPGRLQRIKNSVFVDFAHTPAALESVLKTLGEIKKGKIIVVFGCGGDRDQSKRKKMGEIAFRHADISIITNDNPRSEDPQKIAEEIMQGFSQKAQVFIELDRKKAIAEAISLAAKEDIVLIAGKGHENKQLFTHQVLPFDDVTIAREILSCVS